MSPFPPSRLVIFKRIIIILSHCGFTLYFGETLLLYTAMIFLILFKKLPMWNIKYEALIVRINLHLFLLTVWKITIGRGKSRAQMTILGFPRKAKLNNKHNNTCCIRKKKSPKNGRTQRFPHRIYNGMMCSISLRIWLE